MLETPGLQRLLSRQNPKLSAVACGVLVGPFPVLQIVLWLVCLYF